jgi:hypothetical protein
MGEIKQVWGIIKNYQCADLKMVQDPALAVFQHQQAIIDDLRSQLNNMERCYIGKKKECEEFQKKADEVLEYLDGESANRWGLGKEKADMLDQGASNAFEEAYWMAKRVLRGEHE